MLRCYESGTVRPVSTDDVRAEANMKLTDVICVKPGCGRRDRRLSGLGVVQHHPKHECRQRRGVFDPSGRRMRAGTRLKAVFPGGKRANRLARQLARPELDEQLYAVAGYCPVVAARGGTDGCLPLTSLWVRCFAACRSQEIAS